MATTVESYARMLWALLPPGRIWRPGGVLYAMFTACADELARAHQRVLDLIVESDPRTVSELIPERLRELELDAAATAAENVARITAIMVHRQRYRPVDFQTALAPLLAQDASSVVVIERSHALAASLGDDREIYRFFIYRNPSLPGTYFLASAQAQVDRMKPSHTIGHVIESINFLCDDPHSLCDRDLLGA